VLSSEFRKHGLIPRTLGIDEQPLELPANEVVQIARGCSGAVILGYVKRRITGDEYRLASGDTTVYTAASPLLLPTDWNHLEAGVVFGIGLPIMAFKEDGVSGGVFDKGAVSIFVHRVPMPDDLEATLPAARRAIERWAVQVHTYASLQSA